MKSRSTWLDALLPTAGVGKFSNCCRYSRLSHLLGAQFIHYDDVRVVVLHRLHQDVRLLLPTRHHQAARVAHTGVALVSITCKQQQHTAHMTCKGRDRLDDSA